MNVLDLARAGRDLLRGGNLCLSLVLAKEQNELKRVGSEVLKVTFPCLDKALRGSRVFISTPRWGVRLGKSGLLSQ